MLAGRAALMAKPIDEHRTVKGLNPGGTPEPVPEWVEYVLSAARENRTLMKPVLAPRQDPWQRLGKVGLLSVEGFVYFSSHLQLCCVSGWTEFSPLNEPTVIATFKP